MRDSCDYTLLDLTVVQKRLACPPEEECTHPESGTTRTLYDCPEVLLTPGWPALASGCSNPTGSLLFPNRWSAARGDGLRTVCLHSSVPGFHGERCAGSISASRVRAKRFSRMKIASKRLPAGVLMLEARQEFWQVLSQWMWNLRLELGQHLSPTPMQTTAFAPVLEASQVPPVEQMAEALQASTVVYGPAQWARHSFDFRLSRICFYASTRWKPALSRQSSSLSTRTQGRRAMARIVFCMPLASAIVETVPCVPSVKKAVPLPNHDG